MKVNSLDYYLRLNKSPTLLDLINRNLGLSLQYKVVVVRVDDVMKQLTVVENWVGFNASTGSHLVQQSFYLQEMYSLCNFMNH